MKTLKIFACLSLIAFILSGCELTEPKPQKPEYLISINEIIKYPRATQLEKEIPTIAGTTKWINTAPYLFSNCIRMIETIPNENDKNFMDLKLELNSRGKLLWNQLSADIMYKDLGFVVNDVLYRRLNSDMILKDKEKDEIILLKLKLDPVTAKCIADASKSNYKYFNPDDEQKSGF